MSRVLAMRCLLVACAALLALSACSGDESPKPGPTPTSEAPAPASGDEDALRSAVESYSAAFLSGDGDTAYALLSARCRDRLPLTQFADVAEQVAENFGPMKIKSLEVTVNGTQAQATYTYAEPTLNQQSEPWVNEDGWRVDDC